MPRKNLIRTNLYPYHVCTRSNNKEWFHIPLHQVWSICLRALRISKYKTNVEVEAFVLMANHYHILLFTPEQNLDTFMNCLNSTLSREIRKKTQRINRIFGDRYKWKLINDQSYYMNVQRYIFQNPLRANLVRKCEDYQFSTLHHQMKGSSLGLDLPSKFVKKNYLEFFNGKFTEQHEKQIHQDLRKSGQFFSNA